MNVRVKECLEKKKKMKKTGSMLLRCKDILFIGEHSFKILYGGRKVWIRNL